VRFGDRLDGRRQTLDALERPQVYLENGKPLALFCAAAEDASRDNSFNIQIPLQRNESC